MWEYKSINSKNLRNKLFLDSGTLTPLLRKLEVKGYIKRKRSLEDERNLIVTITTKGIKLRDQAKNIPEKISNCINLSDEESLKLYELLYKIWKFYDI